MMKEDIISVLRLQSIPNIGEISARKLISHCGSAEEVFREKKSVLHHIDGIGTKVTHELLDHKYLLAAEREYRFIEDQNIQTHYFEETSFPKYLRHCPDAPLLLFSRGSIHLENQRIISIVGTRNMTTAGRSFCEHFMEELRPFNPVIVSGFAYGVDICIQNAAVEFGLQTIGCLAHGLNQIYPRAHKRYCAEVEKNGGFFTEFWSTSKPERVNFLKRNRIIAGISQATIVIESAHKGGSLVTADIANSYNRDVFAVPGRPGDIYSEGTNNLIKRQKAHLLTSAADLVYHLNWDIEEREKSVIQTKLFVDLNPVEQSIYNQLQLGGRQLLDDIAMKSKIPVYNTASALLAMELKGVVRPLPGNCFEAI
ncbi:MAG: DNA-protecting protein DprA [Flavobacteriaceae bacterium]|nr:DNA-processing protein DprA [Muriicola sp.]NNC62576.1 DNA-protecting protein DprA [Eudoraea sp.]NNK20949.1 DNA-protecting protein DprA [Flavobacteriaceae bacterium]MBT8290347.1 DNA-processing protein DprA [Muriicola sp.]NNK35543.1 DNA-protecting protein DprA [Eudoraea sp.]